MNFIVILQFTINESEKKKSFFFLKKERNRTMKLIIYN